MTDRDTDEKDPKQAEEEANAIRGEFERWDSEDDPDDAAVARARAAAEAEERGEKPEEPKQTEAETAEEEPAEATGKDQQGQEQGDDKGQEPTAIPYERFKQVNDQLKAAQNALSYMRNAATARAAAAKGETHEAPRQDQQEPQKAPEDLVNEAYSLIDDASQQYDRGEISMREFKQIERQAEEQIWQVRQAQAKPQQTYQETAGDEWVLNQHAAELEEQNAWLGVFDVNDLKRLAAIATETFARNGQPLGEGPKETMRLREKVSELTHTYGPAWYPDQVGNVYGGRQQQSGSQPKQESQAARDGRRALAQAEEFPPDTQQTGRTGESGQISEEDIMNMSEDELMDLPKPVRDRLMGLTA